jgi:hypothetical protein
MKVKSQLHTSVILFPEKDTRYPIDETGSSSGRGGEEKNKTCPFRESNP